MKSIRIFLFLIISLWSSKSLSIGSLGIMGSGVFDFSKITSEVIAKNELKSLLEKDSVTYFVTSTNNFENMRKVFYAFGKDIGEEHTAVHIDLTNPYQGGNGATEYDVIKNSKCDFHPVFEDFIIFEDRLTSSCYTFSIDSEGWLLSTLHQISLNLDDVENMKKSEIINHLKHGIEFDDTKEAVSNNRWIIGEFIDYLASKF